MNPDDPRAPESPGPVEAPATPGVDQASEPAPPQASDDIPELALAPAGSRVTDDDAVGLARGAAGGDEAAPAGDQGEPIAADGQAELAHDPAHGTASHLPVEGQPTFLLFGIVASVSLALDVISKGWAEVTLINRPTTPITLIEDHLQLTLAYNPGGAWGLLTSQSEDIRKPFFVFVSVAAILFIVSLYGRLAPGQRALTWGLPLVLGGALGNLADRITRSQVIDFIDYRADWVRSMNELVAKYYTGWSVTDHWPTFNVADIAICVGVGLMAVDMITSRRGSESHPAKPGSPAAGPQPQN